MPVEEEVKEEVVEEKEEVKEEVKEEEVNEAEAQLELSKRENEELKAKLAALEDSKKAVHPLAPENDLTPDQWAAMEEKTSLSKQQILAAHNLAQAATEPLKK